jgi:hydroxymethylglutaryl-CoA synthase
MVGIVSYGAYVPFYRLSRKSIGGNLRGERAMANFDEDSITMAVAAVMDCLKGIGREEVEGLYFASTTSPYREKQSATTVAVAADLRRDIFTADYANTLRAGTGALTAAADSVGAGSAREVMVAASDVRLGAPGSAVEQTLGDGAAAVLIGNDEVIATLEGSYSVYHEILDVWRTDKMPFIKSWEARFTGTEGYEKSMVEAVKGVLKKTGLKSNEIAKAVLYTPDARASAGVCAKLGFDPQSQLQNPLFDVLGNTGAAYAMMMLVATLEESKPGDVILLANYGNGADAIVFRVTDKINKVPPRGGIKNYLASKVVVEDYRTYLYYRGILPGVDPVYPIPYGTTSAPALLREVDKNIRFHASKCKQCGAVQYPPQRTCIKCQSQDQFQPVRLSEKKAKVFTFSMDHVSSMIDLPVVIPVIDFEGGGRMECFMTDRIVKNVKIGMDVEMTFRKVFEREDIVNYWWKAMPPRF